jgi:hypothetical protein
MALPQGKALAEPRPTGRFHHVRRRARACNDERLRVRMSADESQPLVRAKDAYGGR